MRETYHWQKFIAPAIKAKTYDLPFNRHTFSPTNKLQKNTLSQLRKMGGRRWFHYAWNIWNQKNPVDYDTMSQSLRLAYDRFWTKEPKLVIDAGCGDSADIDVLQKWGINHIGFDLFPRIEERIFNITSIGGHPPITVKRKSNFKIQDICEDWKGVNSNTVDFVLSNAVIDLLTKEERIIFYKNVFKYLRKGGQLIQYGLNLKNGHGHNAFQEQSTLEALGFDVKKERGLIIAKK